MSAPRVLVVAGAASGVGKTTVTLGLLEAFRRRGLTVQAFKVGPDFIDPGFHEIATGRPSFNLDGWMCGRDGVVATVARYTRDADIAVVEGMMGCFDGVDGRSDDGSTAQVAKWLGAPVALVIDASAQSRSAAAVALGFERFDPALTIAAVIANRVGGVTHARWVREAIDERCRAVAVGAIPHDASLVLPERHLGLVTAGEGTLTRAMREHLAGLVERSVDLDVLLDLAMPAPEIVERSEPGGRTQHVARRRARATIGVAHDAAFCFYYRDNLALLKAAGAELIAWSPVSDTALPDVDGLYIGGGYPELHAARLAANAPMRAAIHAFASSGRPVYAECGGLMYLTNAIEDASGTTHAMVGLLPTTVRMRPLRLSIGYAEVTQTAGTPLGPPGLTTRGQEFHASSMDPLPPSVTRAYSLTRPRTPTPEAEGYLLANTLASYIHLHFGSNPSIAANLVASCRR